MLPTRSWMPALLSLALTMPATGLVLVHPRAAWAAPTDFSGTWQLDRAASDSMEPLLKAQGISMVERKIASSLDITQVIQQAEDTLDLEVKSTAKNVVQKLIVDGESRRIESDRTGPSMVSHRWKGTVLITHSIGADPDGVPIRTTITRSLDDGGATMTQTIVQTTDNGTPITVRRVFRRQ